LKILLIGEYSGLNNELKHALLMNGHDVTLAASNDFFKKYPVDINLGSGSNIIFYKLSQLLLPLLKLTKLTGYDVVHVINFYIIPRLPILNLFLIKFLKKNNGIVTLSGAGDDPFFVKYSEKTMRYSPIPPHEKYDRKGKAYYMRSARHLKIMHQYMQYVDGVIPIMYEYYSTFCEAGYSEKVCLPIPIPIDVSKIEEKENYLKDGEIIFFHGLNRYGFKGTFLIEDCFRVISDKYCNDVECLIDGNMPFNEYMALIDRMNVSVDQVFSYSLSMNSLYSMAKGRLVCGGAEPESAILYGGDLPPIYNIKPETDQILSVFEEIISKKEEVSAMAKKGRDFVSKYHAPSLVAKKYLDYWKILSLK